jgi:hypothetical protein
MNYVLQQATSSTRSTMLRLAANYSSAVAGVPTALPEMKLESHNNNNNSNNNNMA